jgi:hypothetical protein
MVQKNKRISRQPTGQGGQRNDQVEVGWREVEDDLLAQAWEVYRTIVERDKSLVGESQLSQAPAILKIPRKHTRRQPNVVHTFFASANRANTCVRTSITALSSPRSNSSNSFLACLHMTSKSSRSGIVGSKSTI